MTLSKCMYAANTMTTVTFALIISHIADRYIRFNFLDLRFFVTHIKILLSKNYTIYILKRFILCHISVLL